MASGVGPMGFVELVECCPVSGTTRASVKGREDDVPLQWCVGVDLRGSGSTSSERLNRMNDPHVQTNYRCSPRKTVYIV